MQKTTARRAYGRSRRSTSRRSAVRSDSSPADRLSRPSWQALLIAGGRAQRLDISDQLHNLVLAELAGIGRHDRRIAGHDLLVRQQDRIPDIAFIGADRRAIRQVNQPA